MCCKALGNFTYRVPRIFQFDSKMTQTYIRIIPLFVRTPVQLRAHYLRGITGPLNTVLVHKAMNRYGEFA